MAKYLDDTALAELVSKTEARYQKASNAVTTDTAQTISAQKTFSKTILSSANEPLNFTGYGSGIYNRAAFVCNTTDKFGVECPRETDSASGTIVPFRIGVRGGQLGDLQTGNLTVGTKAYISTINNGGDITIPSSSGTMALVGDIPTTTSSVTQNSTAVLTSGGAYTALADKVDKVSGKGLSTNDFVSANYYTKTQVDGMISSVYKPAGSVAFANLPTLAAGVLGNVYNVTDSFTTTSDFVEGSGTTYPAGTNVVVVDTSSTSTPSYKFDVLSGFVDLSGYATTSQIPTSVDGLSGGAISSAVTVSASGDTPIIVSSQYYDTYIQFKGAGTVHGHIGVSQTGKPIFFDSSAHELAFASNVPTTTSSVTENSTAALTSGGAYTALAGKQDTLTFDSVPTSYSENPVTSGGIYNAIYNKENATNKVTSISSSSTDVEYPSALAVYNAINAMSGGGGSANSIEIRKIDKYTLAASGNSAVLANRTLTQNICTFSATAGTPVTILLFVRHINNKSQTTMTGKVTITLKIGGTSKDTIENTKDSYAVTEFLGCSVVATGATQQISVQLYSASSSSLAAFAGATAIVIGQGITVSAVQTE